MNSVKLRGSEIEELLNDRVTNIKEVKTESERLRMFYEIVSEIERLLGVQNIGETIWKGVHFKSLYNKNNNLEELLKGKEFSEYRIPNQDEVEDLIDYMSTKEGKIGICQKGFVFGDQYIYQRDKKNYGYFIISNDREEWCILEKMKKSNNLGYYRVRLVRDK